jgi:hypothetical protein
MDSSNEAGKKIVFKRRILASQQAQEPIDFSAPVPVEETQDAKADDSSFFYHGEVFDQFYRPLAVVGGVDRLKELALEPLSPPAPPRRRTKAEREAHKQEYQDAAEALAHQIYQLAQKSREVDLDVYLSAFNVVLRDRSCRESRELLEAANEFFTEQYYTPIRDRGERPEIFHQIVKRVGHESADRIARIVYGLDAENIAEQLWEFYHGAHLDKATRISDILLDCTESQVRTIREEFLLIPYKDLAKQLHSILNRTATNAAPSSKRTIGKSEVNEQKRGTAYRSRDELRAIRYLLLGRSSEEVALISRFYLDLGDPDALESEIGLDAEMRRRLTPADADKAAVLLSGWSPRREAEELYKILYPHSLNDDIDDLLADPRDSVDRDHTQGVGLYLRRFKKRRMWRGKRSVHHRVLNAYELVAERVTAMSTSRFLRTNEMLNEMYGFELDPTMFPSLTLFDARRAAVAVRERLPHCFDFFEVIQPIESLDPRQCLAVQKAYECLFGSSLIVDIEQRLAKVDETRGKELNELFQRYLLGHGRWPLNIDILARYRGEETPPGVWEHDFRVSSDDEDAAVLMAQTIDQDTEIGELDRVIHSLLWEKSYDQLNRIERAFFELTDPPVSLMSALQECLSDDAHTLCKHSLAGVDLNELVQRIYDDPRALHFLKDLAASSVSVVRSQFQRTYFIELEEHLVRHFGAPEQEDILVELLALVLQPEAHRFRVTLQGLRRELPPEVDRLRPFWSGPLYRVMAFERAYDTLFPRLRVHLKYAAARGVLPTVVFAEILLCLEGVDPEVTSRLQECFDGVDVGGLQELLRQNRSDQRVIEEAFDLLHPETPMRRSIKEMKIDLDLINETLLHLEGYFARDVAEEIHSLFSEMESKQLGQSVLEILAVPTPGRPNPRIPEDINWMDEMVFQSALAFQRLYSTELIAALRSRGTPLGVLEDVTIRVFGHEVCTSARDLFNIIKANKEGTRANDLSEERICSYLETRGVRHRERLIRAYNAFWAHTAGFGSLVDDVAKFFRDTVVKKKLVTLLLGGDNDRKSPRSDVVTVH